MDPQKPGNSPGPGPKVVERHKDRKTRDRKLPKSERRKESVPGQCRMR